MKLLTGLQRLNVSSASGCADVLFFTSGKNWKSYKWRRGMTVIVVTAAVVTVSPGFSYTAEKP